MNNKIEKIHIYQPLNPKIKLSKQEQRQSYRGYLHHGYGVHFDGCQMGVVCRGMGEEVRGLRNTSRQLQNSHGDVKYSGQRTCTHDPWT